MKNTLIILLAMAVGFLSAMLWLDHRHASAPVVNEAQINPPTLPAERPDANEMKKVSRRGHIEIPTPPVENEPVAASPAKRTPEELLNELASIAVTSGAGQARAQYRILGLMDQLAECGSPALPAIRQFLSSNRDVSYGAAGNNRNGRTAILPPSLRMGLFDVVRQIGGTAAEAILVESLTATSRTEELVYVAEILTEQSPPGKYTEATVNAAKALLNGGKVTDPSDRDRLYGLLLQYGDKSYVATAQANLVQPDGKLDAAALRYLQMALGEKSLALAAQAFKDTRIADAESKEALGRLALSYVGADDAALDLFHQAALDPKLTSDQRRNLIEDLNQEGLRQRKNPSPETLQVIARRYELTQSYLQQDYVKNDKVLNAAFQEANRDLAKMLERAHAAK